MVVGVGVGDVGGGRRRRERKEVVVVVVRGKKWGSRGSATCV